METKGDIPVISCPDHHVTQRCQFQPGKIRQNSVGHCHTMQPADIKINVNGRTTAQRRRNPETVSSKVNRWRELGGYCQQISEDDWKLFLWTQSKCWNCVLGKRQQTAILGRIGGYIISVVDNIYLAGISANCSCRCHRILSNKWYVTANREVGPGNERCDDNGIFLNNWKPGLPWGIYVGR